MDLSIPTEVVGWPCPPGGGAPCARDRDDDFPTPGTQSCRLRPRLFDKPPDGIGRPGGQGHPTSSGGMDKSIEHITDDVILTSHDTSDEGCRSKVAEPCQVQNFFTLLAFIDKPFLKCN